MSTLRNVFPFLCGAVIIATASLVSGCSGHAGNVIPSLQNKSGSRLHPLDASGSFEQLILQSNPSQYFELEETSCCSAASLGSSGASGTYTSSNVTYSLSGPLQGETSTAIGLPGNTAATATSMGVSLPNASTSGAFTVEDWVYPVFTSTNTSVNAYYTIWGYNSSHRMLINNQSTAKGQLLTQFGGINFRSTKALTPNAWNQVVYVYNGSSESFYINGALDSTQSITGVSIASTYWIGQYDTGIYYKLDGRVGQHAVFPGALSAAVIQSHYAAATSTAQSPTPSPTPSSTPTAGPTGNPQFVQQTYNSQYAPATITVAFKTAPSPGDVLLAFFHNNDTSTNGPITYTPPTGWTQIDVDTTQVATTYEAFYHVAGNSESGNYVFTPSVAGREHVWTALEFSGVNTTSPVDRHGFAFVPRTSTTFTTPSETPSQAGDIAVVTMMPTSLATGSTWTNASGWTVDVGTSSPWATEAITQSQSGTSAVSETSTLSAANFGYAAIVLLSPGSGGSGSGSSKVDWPTWGMKPYRNSYNPVETTLSTSNVGGLHQIWATTAGGVFTDEPVIATNVSGTSEGTADVLYVGDAHANLYAMDANTGNVIWTKTLQTQTIDPNNPATSGCVDQPGGIYGIGGSPTVDRSRNLVYTVDALGNLYGFDLATGTQKTGPVAMWPFQNAVNITNDYSALNEDANAGVIYVPGGAHCGLSNYGGINEYNIATGNVTHWYTEGGPPHTYGGVWGPAGAVIDPRGATNAAMNNIYFGTGDGTAGTNAYPFSIVRLTQSLSLVGVNNPSGACCGDYDYGDSPLVFTPASGGCGRTLVVVENKNGLLSVHDADNISSGPLQTMQIGTLSSGGTNLGTAAYDPTRNLVYINNGSDSSDTSLNPPIMHGLLAFTVTPLCQLQLAWQQTLGPSNLPDGPPAPPTVANGVVYYADGTGTTGCTSIGHPNCKVTADFYAFDASSGSMLYHTKLPGPLFTPPVVVNGHVYLTTWNSSGPGIVYEFGL